MSTQSVPSVEAPSPAVGPATRITVVEAGPLQVKGDFELVAHDGSMHRTRRSVLLCRCGRSATQPFCDGSHTRATDESPAPAGGVLAPPAAASAPAGTRPTVPSEHAL